MFHLNDFILKIIEILCSFFGNHDRAFSCRGRPAHLGGIVRQDEEPVDWAQEPEAQLQLGPRPEPGIGGRTLLLFGNYLFVLSRIAVQGFHLITLIKQEISTCAVRGGRLWSDSVARYPQRFEFPMGRSSRVRLRKEQQPSRIEFGTPVIPAGLRGHPRAALPPSAHRLTSSPTMSTNHLLAFPPSVR